jgi:hypothetical protein
MMKVEWAKKLSASFKSATNSISFQQKCPVPTTRL